MKRLAMFQRPLSHAEKLERLSNQLADPEPFSTYFHFMDLFPRVIVPRGSSFRDIMLKRVEILKRHRKATSSVENKKKFLTDVELLLGHRVAQDVKNNGSILQGANSLMINFVSGQETKFRNILSVGGVQETASSFGLFLYIITRLESSLKDRAIMSSLVDENGLYGVAKGFRLNELARFVSNYGFVMSEEGRSFYLSSLYNSEDNGSNLLKATIDTLVGIVEEQLIPVLESEKIPISFYSVRLKSPFDAYSKIQKHCSEKGVLLNHPEDVASKLLLLHDLVGIRIVVDSPLKGQERAKILDTVGEYIHAALPSKYSINLDQPFASTNLPVRNYHHNPKKNGYDRYHLMFRSEEDIPVEFQIDTSKRYEEIENDPKTSHGVQKSSQLRTLIEGFAFTKRAIVSLEVRLGPYKTIDVDSRVKIEICPDNEVLLREVEKIISQGCTWELSTNAKKKILGVQLEEGQVVLLKVLSKKGKAWQVKFETLEGDL